MPLPARHLLLLPPTDAARYEGVSHQAVVESRRRAKIAPPPADFHLSIPVSREELAAILAHAEGDGVAWAKDRLLR